MPRKPQLPGAQPDMFFPAIISFRLDEQSSRVLGERAARLDLSPHELARHYVLELLEQSEERAALREALQQLVQNQQKFHADFAFAVQALLTSAGKVSSEKAEAWVAASIHL